MFQAVIVKTKKRNLHQRKSLALITAKTQVAAKEAKKRLAKKKKIQKTNTVI